MVQNQLVHLLKQLGQLLHLASYLADGFSTVLEGLFCLEILHLQRDVIEKFAGAIGEQWVVLDRDRRLCLILIIDPSLFGLEDAVLSAQVLHFDQN